jgi:LAS superfamily LD-carboxypeptidase LdcB
VFNISSRRIIFSAIATVVIFALQSPDTAIASTNRSKVIRNAKQKMKALKTSSRLVKASASRHAACGQCEAATRSGAKLKSRAKWAKAAPCHSKSYVDPKIAKNFNAAMHDLKRAGIKPQVTSIWRSSQDQARLHKCSGSRSCRRANPGLYRALPPGQSLHEAGLAVDMSGIATGPRGAKRLTPRGRRVVGIMQKNGFRWRYGLADPAHFEANPRKVGYRNAKQAIARSQSICEAKVATNTRADKKPVRGHQLMPVARRIASLKQQPTRVNSPGSQRQNAKALVGR